MLIVDYRRTSAPSSVFFQLGLGHPSPVKLQSDIQGSYGSWKTWKVIQFSNFIFQARKIMEFRVMESHVQISWVFFFL